MPEATAPPPTPAKTAAKSAPQKAMEKLGLVRDIDLALHLPMRYEDEPRLTPIGALREGEPAQRWRAWWWTARSRCAAAASCWCG